MDYLQLINKYPEHTSTCSITNLKDKCFAFIRHYKWLSQLDTNLDKDVVLLVPEQYGLMESFGFKYEYIADLDYTFVMLHNELRKNERPAENQIGNNCMIHETAVLDVEGIHIVNDSNGNRYQMQHKGNVVIEDNVMVLALTTIQRAVFDSTIIKKGVKIDSRVNIGHNCYIGENTAIALGVIVAGSVTIGKNCSIGLGAIIRNGVSICDNVIIGMGAVVVSNITEPGIYMGVPAKYYKPTEKDWNFPCSTKH